MSVVQREAPCWIVKEIRTKPYQHAYPEPDWHFDTLEAAASQLDLTEQAVLMEEGIAPCWLAKCARCEQTLGGDDFDEAHYPTRDEAEFHEAEIDDHCDLESR